MPRGSTASSVHVSSVHDSGRRVDPAWVLVGLLSLLLQGCPSPNIYATARTIPQGKLSHTLAVEGIGFSADSPDTDNDGEPDDGSISGFIPSFVPTYQLRYGATDNLELGARIATFATLGLDLKYNFLRDSAIDLAINPSVQAMSVGVAQLVHLNLPLIIDVNINKTATLVLTPGVMQSLALASVDFDEDGTAVGTMARAGLGVNLRLGGKFAMQPEVTFLKPIAGDDDNLTTLLYTVGIGFNFVNLPSFDDVE
jgi:hypothetical protein